MRKWKRGKEGRKEERGRMRKNEEMEEGKRRKEEERGRMRKNEEMEEGK